MELVEGYRSGKSAGYNRETNKLRATMLQDLKVETGSKHTQQQRETDARTASTQAAEDSDTD